MAHRLGEHESKHMHNSILVGFILFILLHKAV
jgi:hypothetical protein